MKQRSIWLFPLLLLALWHGQSRAAPITPLSVEELTQQAAYIINGRVVDVRGEWNADRTRIYSRVTVAIHQCLKGDYPDWEITLLVLGGTAPDEDIAMIVSELPTFEIETDVVLFLKGNLRTLAPVIAETQGAFALTTDQRSGEIVATNGEGFALPKSELAARIQTALQK